MAMMEQPVPRRRPLLSRLFLSPGERRLRAGWRLLAHLVLLLVLLTVLGILLGGIWGRLNGSGGILFGMLITLLSITVSVYLARRFFDRRRFISLGLTLDRWTLRDLLAGFGVSGVIMGVVFLAEWAAGWLTFDGFSWRVQSLLQALGGAAAGFLLFLVVGWQEELLSRGYWLQNLEQGLNLFWAVCLSSLFFALAHLGNPNVSWMAVLGLLVGGVFLAFGYVRTRLLWLSIGLHIGWNFFEGTVFGFPVSGLSDLPHLIDQQSHGPILVTGGAFGPEAGLIILPAILIGVALVYIYTRGRKLAAGDQTSLS